jgi:G6PDH family F420-dependent oxidoreductase
VEIGYKLSSEEHGPRDLIRNAARSEELGFTFALISDHFHPWVDNQGHSPFVWSVIGGIAQATTSLRVGTGVTCPTMRTHPALIAHAAATSALLMPGRFFLGVGSGEALNEHIFGDRWPAAPERIEMLAEAIDVMRLLWEGGQQSHHGKHYTVENARLYDLPDEPVPVYVAASGEKAARLAGKVGDGLVSVAPDEDTVKTFESSGGAGKPKYAEMQVCWAPSKDEAKKTVREIWPNAGLGGQLSQELALPSFFEQATDPIPDDEIISAVALGLDPEQHLQSIKEYADAGYDHICVHQIGRDQEGFFDFYAKEIFPRL